MKTRVSVQLRNGRHQTMLSAGTLRAQQVHSPPDRCRIALLATTALLLGGDEVALEVEVGAGATLELSDVAGTVAYDGRGRASTWRVRLHVGEDARLRWAGQPLVLSDGAEVLRVLEVELAPGAVALVRETIALGRSGEVGGTLCSRTTIRRDERDVLVESLSLDATRHRTSPGMLGESRVIDTVLALGLPGPETTAGACQFALLETGSTVTRYLGRELASSPLHAAWRGLSLPRAQPSSTDSAPAATD